MRARAIIGLGLCAAPWLALTAQELPASLSPATRQAIVQLGDSLRGAKLPADPLYSKAAEGVLKGADETRILAAVRTLARELGEARDALGASSDDAELVAGASALHAGVPAAALRRLREASRGDGRSASLATPLVVLADLLLRGVPAPAASGAIDSMVVRRAQSVDFAALRAGIERDIQAGRRPEEAMSARMRVVLDGLDRRR
jgi:hypothetical protein